MGYHGNVKTMRKTSDVLHDGSEWMRTDEVTFEFEHGQHWFVTEGRFK